MDIGEVAATHLINQLRGNATNNTSSIVLKSELIIRASSQKK
jgi:DNA-binding LacI/PurR family transcriptional regulator